MCDGGGWWRAWLCECVCVSGVGSASFSLCGSKELHVEMDVDMWRVAGISFFPPLSHITCHFRIVLLPAIFVSTSLSDTIGKPKARSNATLGSGDICQIYATFSVGACDIGCIVGVDDQSMVGFE